MIEAGRHNIQFQCILLGIHSKRTFWQQVQAPLSYVCLFCLIFPLGGYYCFPCQIFTQTFVCEVKSGPICTDIVSLTGVVIMIRSLRYNTKWIKIARNFLVFAFVIKLHRTKKFNSLNSGFVWALYLLQVIIWIPPFVFLFNDCTHIPRQVSRS